MLTVDWVIVVEIGSLIKANQKDICLHWSTQLKLLFHVIWSGSAHKLQLTKGNIHLLMKSVNIYQIWYLLRENHTVGQVTSVYTQIKHFRLICFGSTLWNLLIETSKKSLTSSVNMDQIGVLQSDLFAHLS